MIEVIHKNFFLEGMIFMNYERVLVVGDIHSHYKKFISLYKKLNVDHQKDLLIFLGDYIDRGESSEEIINMLKFIIDEAKKPNVICLLGNHEQMMIDFFDKDNYGWIFPGNGGRETLKAINEWMKVDENCVARILNFVDSCKLFYQITINGKNYFLCHAGVDYRNSLDKQTGEALLWYREKFFMTYNGDTIIVGGHTPLQMLKPENEYMPNYDESEYTPDGRFNFDKNIWRSNSEALKITDCKPQWRRNRKILMMDTGSFLPKGFISCIDLISGKIFQSD